MVQTQTKSAYTAATFATKDQAGYAKKSQYEFKGQDRKEITKMGADKKQDPWGKTFKSEQHFKSMHICWTSSSIYAQFLDKN